MHLLYIYILIFKSSFGSSCDSHQHLLLVVISGLQSYKTDFSIYIGWYINIVAVKLRYLTVNLKCCYRIFYNGRIPGKHSCQVFTIDFTNSFYSVSITLLCHPAHHHSIYCTCMSIQYISALQLQHNIFMPSTDIILSLKYMLT